MGKFSLSPSGWERWSTCPGSVGLIASLDITEEPKHYSAEGTVAHSICEDAMREGREPWEYIGEVREADGFTVVVTDEMAEACEMLTDYLRVYPSDLYELLIESHLPLDLGIKGLRGGRTDFIIHDATNKYIEVIDYKHGQGVAVDIDGNGQLLIYLFSFMLHLKEKGYHLGNYRFKITIVQPRTFHPQGKIRSQTWAFEQLNRWVQDELIPKAKRCSDENPIFQASAEACRFCQAAPCAEQERHLQEMAIIDFDGMGDESEEVKTVPIEKLTVDQKVFLLKNKKLVESFLNKVEEEVFKDIELGSTEYVKSYKIVKSIPKRQLTKDALDPIFSPIADYLDEEECFNTSPKSLGDLEKAIKAKIRESGITKGVPALAKKVIDQITEKPDGKPCLVPASDNREALPSKAARDFKDC